MQPCPALAAPRARAAWFALLVAALAAVLPAHADAPAEDALAAAALALARASARPVEGVRVEVEAGRLDPRLKLAACAEVEPYLPIGFKPWGRTRIGLRCVSGPVHWNVSLPIRVKVHGRALVAAHALPAGSVLEDADLAEAEIDLAGLPQPALIERAAVLGRSLARPLAAGAGLQAGDLRARQWFAAGETVQLIAAGAGFSVQTQGQALGAGLDGATVRVRTEGGRVLSGTAVGERRVELPL